MKRWASASLLLGLFSIACIFLSYLASSDVPLNLSPQGCRMAWMTPSYVLQAEFDASWTPLATRYSLWLYREVDWQPSHVLGVPVLFIPGNAGSSRQVRSIASSAVRQFFQSPGVVAPVYVDGKSKFLDFFVVEFNEDLSALHGPTLDTEIEYTSRAISYILSLYPPNTSIIVMGHSMGGIVATSLLPSENISAIITMSTPHTLPPARFDSRIDKLYAANQRSLLDDPTPILSLCGGATDSMIVSESCVLPSQGLTPGIYRKTIFTSGLEGAWTGVGHREMVWCDQVRSQVARAALALGTASSNEARAAVLDGQLRDGLSPPPTLGNSAPFVLADTDTYEALSAGAQLVLNHPQGSRMYLLPVTSQTSRLVLLISQGSMPTISLHSLSHFRVSVHFCEPEFSTNAIRCSYQRPTVLKLIPNPAMDEPFPRPDEGVSESESIVLFEADITPLERDPAWVGVLVESASGEGWVVAGLEQDVLIRDEVNILKPFFEDVFIPLRSADKALHLRTKVHLPTLISSSLVVYKSTPLFPVSTSCLDPLLSPLLVHSSGNSEAHFFAPTNGQPILLHTHRSGPFIADPHQSANRGLELTIYSTVSAGCPVHLETLRIRVDWWSTLGRTAARYFTTAAAWAIAVAALVFWGAWRVADDGGSFPSVKKSLSNFETQGLPKLLLASFLVSFLPMSEYYYLGNKGEPLFAPIAPLLLLLSTGLVCVSWWVLCLIMWPLGKLCRLVFGSRNEKSSVAQGTVISMFLVFVLIFFVVPWQVAFLGCWLVHLCTCATTSVGPPAPTTAVPLLRRDGDKDDSEAEDPPLQSRRFAMDRSNQNMHILLLMTWLLPLTAPALAVWVRTTLTAGFTPPLDGDQVFLNVAPFLILVDFASWTATPPLGSHKIGGYFSVSWYLVVVAVVAFIVGSRAAFRIFEAANVGTACAVIVRIGPRYWGGQSWLTLTRSA